MKSRKQRKQMNAEITRHQEYARLATDTQTILQNAQDRLQSKLRSYWYSYQDQDVPRIKAINAAWYLMAKSQTALDRKDYSEIDRLCKIVAERVKSLSW
jgi:hypothetical protein